jgi:tetratricopeptide (TPR) repeat protein
VEKLTPEIVKAELVQINMYITLAEAFLAQGNYDDAIDILNKASNLEEGYNQYLSQNTRGDPKTISKNIKTLALKAQCFCKQKHFEEALSVIDEVVAYTKSKLGGKVEYAFALVDRANILADMDSTEKYQKAI